MLQFLQTLCDKSGEFPGDLMQRMKDFVEGEPSFKKDTKVLMQFGAFMRDEAKDRGPDALAVELPFDQKAILEVSNCFTTPSLPITFFCVKERF
jgi:hypothetical protein